MARTSLSLAFVLLLVLCAPGVQRLSQGQFGIQSQKVDINSASVSELEKLPNVNPELARKIFAGRPYSKINDLEKAGVPRSLIKQLESLIVASPVQREPPGRQGGTVASAPKAAKTIFVEGGMAGNAASYRQAGLSDRVPELTDRDRQRMAEIEQRPEIQASIRAAWDEIRRKDLDYAFAINSSGDHATTSARQAVNFKNEYGQLYENPVLQRYVNSIGQRLVPKDSPNVYSFRVLLDPLPRAEALSTGTTYLSTGLISVLDNEAQLSYVLAHEIAHIEKSHRYNEVKNTIIQEELNADKERAAARKQEYFKVGATLAGGTIGGLAGIPERSVRGALAGAAMGFAGSSAAAELLFPSKNKITEWNEIDENEADEAALDYMLAQDYDAREIPRLFARMNGLTSRDSRVGLGFIARADRVKLRTSHIQELLSGNIKAQVDAKLKGGGLVASSPEFPLLMSALKRDNGIIALDYDLFAMARDNLEEAVNLRSNDARSHLYLGKVISMTARTAEDRQAGMNHYLKAIQYDEGRGAYPDPHLERAIDMIAQNDPSQQDDIRKELQLYVALYQRENKGTVPTNMPIIYDYMQLAGDTTWYVAPTSVVSTKYVEALHVASGGQTGPATVKELTHDATNPALETVSSTGNASIKTVARTTAQSTSWSTAPSNQALDKAPQMSPRRGVRVIGDLSQFHLEQAPKSKQPQTGAGSRSAVSTLTICAPSSGAAFSTRPLFEWRTPDGGASKVTFSLRNDNGDVLYENGASGTTFEYPADAPALKPGHTYSWKVSGGGMDRLPEPVALTMQSKAERDALQTALASASDPLAHAQVYLQKGVWYDTVADLESAIRTHPERKDLQEQLRKLYQEIAPACGTP